MTIFAVIAPQPNEALASAIKERFPNSYYEIAPGQYLVSLPRGTVKQVLDALGLTQGGLGRALILRVSSYNGWHAKDMWEWIAAQSTPPPPASDLFTETDE